MIKEYVVLLNIKKTKLIFIEKATEYMGKYTRCFLNIHDKNKNQFVPPKTFELFF